MSPRSFEQEWREKVKKVRSSKFWKQVSSPPSGRIETGDTRKRKNEIEIDADWSLLCEGDLSIDGPATIGIQDLRGILSSRFGVHLKSKAVKDAPKITFELRPSRDTTRWDCDFRLHVSTSGVIVRGASEQALLRASLYLSNYWSLRRGLYLTKGRRTIRPAIPFHVGADLWGGFCTTPAWVYGRESDANFLELARMGINAVPIMAVLDDYLNPDPKGPFRSLANPQAKRNRKRLSTLAKQASRFGIHILLMGYNPKLEPDHPVFKRHPGAAGALQSGGVFRTLCSSDRETRKYLVGEWASLFREIPDLGGVIAITGGEGFYHCFMRSKDSEHACPRCSRRNPSKVVAELVNHIARGIRSEVPEARLLTWPYSAGHWSGDRDQVDYISYLDPEHVIFQTEIDKDSVHWREAGYAKDIWDYSISHTSISDRCRHQRRLCKTRNLKFSVKTESNNSIECLNVPYLPVLENQKGLWRNAKSLKPFSIHSRWLFDGSCKGPSEEMGYWMIWGNGTEFEDPDDTLTAIAQRDFGDKTAPIVRRAWRLFSEGMRHHPQLDYYRGTYFIGPAQPLVLEPNARANNLDPSFFGQFYWHWENSVTGDDTILVTGQPLFFSSPNFRAFKRRGLDRNRDVALEELREMAELWERGVKELEKARQHVPPSCRTRFKREFILCQHLAYTWRSGANVEEFLRLRDIIREFSGRSWVRSGHERENVRDLHRMEIIAREELSIAKKDFTLVRNTDFLDLGLRLDMGTASTPEILKAKIDQVTNLLKHELPAWRQELLRW